MKKTLLAIIITAGLSVANEVSVDVPITINNAGGCVFEGLSSTIDFGNVPQTAYAESLSTYNLPAVNFGVKCSAGINYTVSIQGYNSGQDILLMQRNGGSEMVRLGLFKDSARSQKISSSNPNITSGTGNGSTQTINLYPRLEGCNSTTCPPGTYTKTVTIRITY